MDIALVEFMEGQLKQTTSTFHRYMCGQISWESRMFGLVGPRGVGKSTLILQYIKEHRNQQRMMYVAADHLYFSSHTLAETVDEFVKEGGEQIFIDEIHKYENWSRELKQIYDSYPSLKVGFTGSSVLDIYKGFADLSRRAPVFMMQGLSFREYLMLRHGIEMPVYPLEEVLANPAPLIRQMNQLGRPVALFHEYLKYGYYPYYLENEIDYYVAIQQVVNNIIDDELPRICNVDVANTRKIKSLMTMLCASEPFQVDISKMSVQSGLKRDTVVAYLNYMGKAKLLQLLYCDLVNVKRLQKPDKIYIDNPNMLYAWATNPVKIGTVRETFVVNQLVAKHKVEFMKKQGDFFVDSKYTIEVGGEDKDFSQVANVPDSYILADNIETAIGHKLPIWSIGFLY